MPLQTSCRENRHIIRHARIEPTVSLTTDLTQTAPSLQPLRLSEPSQVTQLQDIWYHDPHYVCCQCHPPIHVSVCIVVLLDGIGQQLNEPMLFSAMTLDSI
ncbi:hypothetical protein TNCV_1916921 [Trichonephila clavipes]|uniref:Uncharacterized protein n=1 Tax=Trichonephila clavipes TaxID=2585209 RepID=A0A8X6W0D9_TRICX|nr:hypothetical protein TNCV_1916921 [Trichonephila clavipes]